MISLQPSQNTKITKTNEHSSDSSNILNYKLKKSITYYKHFVYSSWLSPDEIVAVSVNPVTLIEQLPPSLKQKKFGIS